MKKLITIAVAVILVVSMLAACGAKEVDLKALMSDINTQYGISGLKTIDDTDNLSRYYQINADEVKQFAAEMTTAASQYTEIVLVEAKDEKAVANIAALLTAHKNAQLNNAKSYDADQVSMIEACEVKQTGNYVYLVISDQYSDIVATIEKALK